MELFEIKINSNTPSENSGNLFESGNDESVYNFRTLKTFVSGLVPVMTNI